MRAQLGVATVIVALLQFCGTAFAEKRLALVIGNSSYEKVAKLPNPVNDATAVADLFRAAGFDAVTLRTDLDGASLRRAVREFSDAANDADVAVVYFAGHGIEVDGINYLIPTDARLATDLDVEDETVSLDRVLKLLEPAKRLRLVILDACRDNPFVPTMKHGGATRSIGRGLARVETTTKNTVVAFAAQAGTTAADGTGGHSPFTEAILKNITVPGRDLRFAFGYVRDEVRQQTGGRQEPFFYASLGGETFALVSSPAEPKPADPPHLVVSDASDVAHEYESAERVGTPQAWDAFLGTHGTGLYADLAREQRRKLEVVPRPATPAAQTSNVAPPPVAEAPKTETTKAGTVVASVTPTAPVEPAVTPVERTGDMIRQTQTELKRVGCYTGAIDGVWNAGAESAAKSFNKHAGVKVATRSVSGELLDALHGKTSRVCPLTCQRGYRANGERCVAIVCKSGHVLGSDGTCHRQAAKVHRTPARRDASAAPAPTQANEPPPPPPMGGCIGFRRHGFGGFGGFGGRVGC